MPMCRPARLIDELDRLGIRDNTLVFYIFGDNGSSAEGQNGTISELLAQNGIPNTVEQQLAALDKLGGLDVLGGPKTDNMYHAGWAWAGGTPFQGTKLIGARISAERATRWRCPGRRGSSRTRRRARQFHHVNDIVPTIYDIIGIKPPKVVDGFEQDPIDGVSMAYTFADRDSAGPERRRNISRTTAAAASIRTAGSPAHSGRSIPWDTAGSNAAIDSLGRRTRTSGSSMTFATTSRRPTISPPRTRRSWPN